MDTQTWAREKLLNMGMAVWQSFVDRMKGETGASSPAGFNKVSVEAIDPRPASWCNAPQWKDEDSRKALDLLRRGRASSKKLQRIYEDMVLWKMAINLVVEGIEDEEIDVRRDKSNPNRGLSNSRISTRSLRKLSGQLEKSSLAFLKAIADGPLP